MHRPGSQVIPASDCCTATGSYMTFVIAKPCESLSRGGDGPDGEGEGEVEVDGVEVAPVV
jgi:hypothetical protein